MNLDVPNFQEIDVLTNPKMRHTRELHIISGELSLLKRTLYPIYNMVNALRDHRPPQKKGYFHPNVATGRGGTAAGNVTTPGEYYEMKVRGTDISDAAKVYLADVADHVLILTEEVDILRGTVENMINLVCPSFLISTYERSSIWLRRHRTRRCDS